ncbi:MAG: hypothetical protein IJ849_01150 [Selenomonadaceae bacterium]|nr:hypothetical protein [Selenomonadaceae bacterium]
MKFSEFAQKLRTVIGNGANTHEFARTILDAIINEDGTEILDGKSASSYKAYYNGKSEITALAKEISIYVEPTEFEEYLKQFPDQSIQKLCDIFGEHIEGISPHNALEEIAEFFANIIYDAAGEKRKTQGSKTTDYAEKTTQECQKESLTLVQQQNNVIMNGENNLNLTNHGTMNFNFGGD